MKKLLPLLVLVLLGAGCAPVSCWETNQLERQRIFKECMELLPDGPEVTDRKSDWDNVVRQCDTVAYRQAQERTPECN